MVFDVGKKLKNSINETAKSLGLSPSAYISNSIKDVAVNAAFDKSINRMSLLFMMRQKEEDNLFEKVAEIF